MALHVCTYIMWNTCNMTSDPSHIQYLVSFSYASTWVQFSTLHFLTPGGILFVCLCRHVHEQFRPLCPVLDVVTWSLIGAH